MTRKGTLYCIKTSEKKIALSFDDGPSPQWTPLILKELRKANIKATFFMTGAHVEKYPHIARQVVAEGHEIGNHGYEHNVILYYTPQEIEEEIRHTEAIIQQVTGKTTRYFRPPKAWLRNSIKQKIASMGYHTVLWSLNSKDWVKFSHRSMVKYFTKRIKNGDILLFHDSGNIFNREGGDRTQTVAAIPLLADKMRQKGYEFVTLSELLNSTKILPLPEQQRDSTFAAHLTPDHAFSS